MLKLILDRKENKMFKFFKFENLEVDIFFEKEFFNFKCIERNERKFFV